MPRARFERTSDGEGVALIHVIVEADTIATLFADEDDSEAPIDGSKKITLIETFNPACRTGDGIRPEMPVVEAAKILGPVERILRSEIESREFINFERQPYHLTLRLDYTGEFAEGSSTTRSFSAGAKILSVTVSTPPPGLRQ